MSVAGSQVLRSSQMSEAGIYITTTLVWFQFIAIQIIAAVMLSTTISDEIYHRTLGTLMTTPINSFQIVIGKLLSKLLQLILLLAISLPLLMIIRVFGGVPWGFVISSFCITLSVAVFTGAVSLLFSIYNRQTHAVIIGTLFACFLFYVVPPLMLQLLRFTYNVPVFPESALFYINPFMALNSITDRMVTPSSAAAPQSWVMHCVIMSCLSALLLGISMLCIRSVGRRQATGQAGVLLTRKERRLADKKIKINTDSIRLLKKIRPVKGPPIIWRAIISPFAKTSRIMMVLKAVILVLVLTFAYGYCGYKNYLARNEIQLAFILAYFALALLRTATASATCITSEKESRTWPILLTTPLSEKHIALGKIFGSCLQAWLFWFLLYTHIVVFSIAGRIALAAFIPLILLVVSSALLISSVGVCFSSCFKRSSISSAVNLILFFCFTIPVCCPLPIFIASPLFIIIMILGNTGGWHGLVTPFRITSTSSGSWLWNFALSQLAYLVPVIVYLLLAFGAFAIATSNIRRKIF
jgi:ABC-type transport system involved in multi-copper enzyme maturation permease subunit